MACPNALAELSQTRGDTVGYTFQRLSSTGQVIKTTPQSLFFTVKHQFTDKEFVIQKKMNEMTLDNDGTWHFVLQSEDTESLDYGAYVFDIQVTDDDAVTTIAKGRFRLTEEATWAINEGE